MISLPGRLGPGSRFHNWSIERLIAKGGMGVVYFARHQLVGRPAAVKVIAPAPGTVADEKTMARFHTEVEIHVSLRLPNLPDFYDAELLPDGTAVLVLEYLDGRDLGDALNFLGRLPLGDALFVATEILRPLQVVHAKSVHRDIKPSNVFIRRRPRFDSEGRIDKNRVTLLDFGIAQVNLKKSVTREHAIVGTKFYMSPEQLQGERLDGRSDQYALGVVLYEMLCGHPPFAADPEHPPTLPEVMLKTLTEPIPDLRERVPDLPDDVWAFISVLLSKGREQRYPTTDAALEVARNLRKRYRETTKLFHEDVDDILAAMDELKAAGWTAPRARPVTNPMATEPSIMEAFETTEETPPPANDFAATPEQAPPPLVAAAPPASPVVLETPPPAPAPQPVLPKEVTASIPPAQPSLPRVLRGRMERTTDRMRGVRGKAVAAEWEDREINRVRVLLRSPRVFRRPALVELDPDSKLPAYVHEIRHNETLVGSRSDAGLWLEGARPRHAVLQIGRDRDLEIDLLEEASTSSRALVVDGTPTTGARLGHGSIVELAERTFEVVDLTVADPTGQRSRVRRRAQPPVLSVRLEFVDGTETKKLAMERSLVLVGASRECDVVLPDGPVITLAAWMRGDGEIELAEIDASVLPYGQAIGRCWLVRHNEEHTLPNGDVLTVLDPPEASRIEVGTPPRPMAAPKGKRRLAPPPEEAKIAPPREQPAKMVLTPPSREHEDQDRLVLLAAIDSGLKAPIPAVLPLPLAPLVLGRADGVDLQIHHPAVRPRHVFLKMHPNGKLQVEQIGDGRLDVRGEPAQQAMVEDGETITIPGVATFELRRGRKPTIFTRAKRFFGFSILALLLAGTAAGGSSTSACRFLSDSAASIALPEGSP